jgi:hypothetical protein
MAHSPCSPLAPLCLPFVSPLYLTPLTWLPPVVTGIVHLPLRLLVNWPHLLPFTRLTHPTQIPRTPPTPRLINDDLGNILALGVQNMNSYENVESFPSYLTFEFSLLTSLNSTGWTDASFLLTILAVWIVESTSATICKMGSTFYTPSKAFWKVNSYLSVSCSTDKLRSSKRE